MKPIELTGDQFKSILGKEGMAKMERLNTELGDIGKQIFIDQQQWVEKCMKDILPPDLYDDCIGLRNLEKVAAYVAKHNIRFIYMADTLRMRIMIGDQIYGEWKANLTVDGEPVSFVPGNN
jgi:hypothetical protein